MVGVGLSTLTTVPQHWVDPGVQTPVQDKVGSFVPLVVDDYLATLSAHQNADVALQT